MITSPLNLKNHISEPDRSFDIIPFIDLCIIGLFFLLNSSRFILPPGVTLDLPKSDSGLLAGVPTTAVMTIREEDTILFQGDRLNISTVGEKMKTYVENAPIHSPILLLKVGRNVNIQELLDLAGKAREAGFISIQIAAEERENESPESTLLNPEYF